MAIKMKDAPDRIYVDTERMYDFWDASRAIVAASHAENPTERDVLYVRADTHAAFMEEVRGVLEPLALISEHDIGTDEADSDLYRPMDVRYAVADPVKVGHLRAARALLAKMEGK